MISIIGDTGKIVMKAEKEAIAEATEKFVKQGVEKETAEKLAKEEVAKLTKEAEAEIAKQQAKQTSKQTGKLEVEVGREMSDAEKSIADKLVAEGRQVKAPKEVNIRGVKNPDFEVDGIKTELKTIENITSADMGGAISRRIYEAGKQAPNVIIDATNQAGMTKEIAENAAERAFLLQKRTGNERLQEVRLIGKGFDFTVRK